MHRYAPLALATLLLFAPAALSAEQPSKLIDAAGVKGGLVVHVGCTDGALTAGLRIHDRFLVQGLAAEADVAAAGEKAAAGGAYGAVSITAWDGKHLPYVDNMVNLLVVSKTGDITAAEVERVLAPKGAALIADGRKIAGLKTAAAAGCAGWTVYRKPWPQAIDEWTHFLHDPRGTSVSDDEVAAHPRGLRWTGGPFWARSHEHTAGMNAMVSAGGRVFYVMDEGLTESIQLPAENYLTARDAFNGTVLWKKPLPDWFNHLYPLKSGPGWLPRRLVAVGDRVYISPGVGHDLVCLDAATGKEMRTYDETATTFELIVSGGVVFAAVDPDRKPVDYRQQHPNCWRERDRASKKWQWQPETGVRVLKALAADSDTVRWEKRVPVAPMTLAADDRMVCFYDGDHVVALNRSSGDELWKAEVSAMKQIRTGYAGPRLIICEDRVVFSPMGRIFTIAAKDGEILWTVKKKPRSGHFSLEDFYVIGEKVWVLGRPNKGVFTTYGLQDGTQLDQFSNPINSFYIHQRCYPGRATGRYQYPPMMGIMVYDMKEDTWENNHWVRGGCIYGITPANGLIYATPHACACYYQTQLNGFCALAPQPTAAPRGGERLVKGPAFGKHDKTVEYPASDWPVFRHDNTRSGTAGTAVAAEPRQAWKADFGTKISQPVVAGGKLCASAVDRHTVFCLDAATGEGVWSYRAGARVDSPPTLYKGLALFGCADGCVYALDAGSGTLAWKFRAAPGDRRIVSYGRVESAWPVHGSVLVQDGKLYCTAGRSLFLDGGMRMVILNPETGELVAENVMDRKVPGTDKQLDDLITGKHMPVGLPDVLSSDGKHVYMKSQTFTMDGKRVRVNPQRPDTQYDEEVHLFSPISFLDDSWHHRTYWIYGRAAGEGWAEFQLPPKRVPCGRIMCIDDTNAYSYGRDPGIMCNSSVNEYRLFSAKKTPSRKVGIPRIEGKRWPKAKYPVDKKNALANHTVDWKNLSKQPMKKLTALDFNWVNEEPAVMAKAMVLAGDRLFVAGPRDVVDEREMWGRSNEDEFRKKMQLQAEWLKGTRGGVMQVFSKQDGKKLAELKLDGLPAFDGMIAADGKLYMVTAGGSVVCFGGT